MNPARVIGPALVFLCTPQKAFWFYLLGEGIGAVLAGLWATGTFKVAAGDTPGDGSKTPHARQLLLAHWPRMWDGMLGLNEPQQHASVHPTEVRARVSVGPCRQSCHATTAVQPCHAPTAVAAHSFLEEGGRDPLLGTEGGGALSS